MSHLRKPEDEHHRCICFSKMAHLYSRLISPGQFPTPWGKTRVPGLALGFIPFIFPMRDFVPDSGSWSHPLSGSGTDNPY
jgi:hypothetical protein